MSTEDDRVRLIAERVARRVAASDVGASTVNKSENGPNRHETNAMNASGETSGTPRARVINFISSGPPVRSASSIGRPHESEKTSPQVSSNSPPEYFQFVPVAQSPWLGRLPSMLANENPHSVDHPSQQRFGVEEATVAELVEFFENEKKCSMDPSGKPCDHCAMCSSRGF
ncbi:MAG: hypothetical protein WAQ99_08320 [Pyrinomonadaceae bacterium]